MKVVITGAAGFIGTRVARALLAGAPIAGRVVSSLVLVDQFMPTDEVLLRDARVRVVVGDLTATFAQWMAEGPEVVFHLASAVSAECEAHFELGLRANLDATRALLEACRARAEAKLPPVRLVFASSVAVFGADPGLPLPAIVADETLPTPQSSYGVQKFICEQLIADYTRKGYVDGRAVRLMTVVVRPGRPNGAASGFLSGIIREPLAGQSATCPVPLDMAVAVSSPARTVEGLLCVAGAPRAALGGRTALNLPALTVTVAQMLEALQAVGGAQARALVRAVPDAAIARIVGSWPARFDARRARALGLAPDADFLSIVRQYVLDATPAIK